MAQMTNGNLRKTNREMLRNYRTMNHHAMGSSSSNSRTNNNSSSSSSPASPTKRTRENTVESSTGGIIGSGSGGSSVESGLGTTNVNHHHSKKLASMAVVPDDEGGSGRSSASAMETDEDNITRPHYMEYMHAPPAPVWSKGNTTTANSTDIDSELLSTYKYPRLCLQDPIHIIEGLLDGRYNNNDQVVRREMWWFHAAHRMETTLRHVQEDHWRGMLSTMMMATTSSTTNSTSSSIAPPAMTNYTSNLTSKMKGSDSTNSFATPTTTDGCVAMEELCLGKQHQQQHHHQQQPFSPSNTPTNVWSEPCASTMNVRGRTYSRDGVKVESGPSLFVMLGVDSFVSGGGEKSAGGGVDSNSTASSSLGTASYLRRWRGVCAEMELHQPPFL